MIDLRSIAGKRYKLGYDPAYRAEKRRGHDSWLAVVPCRRGHIYVHSAELLGVATDTRHCGLKLAAIAGVEIVQDGDDGMNLTFPPELLPRVAAIVKPRRRRQVSDKDREHLANIRAKALLARDSAA